MYSDLLSYDKETGIFKWKVTRNGFVKAGSIAGSRNSKGYIVISVHNGKIKAHRMAFLIQGIDIPKGMHVDHINGIKDDNRWCNLRITSPRENSCNGKRHREGKLVGARKVRTGRWQASVTYNKKWVSLGTYDTELEAHKAYLNFIEENT